PFFPRPISPARSLGTVERSRPDVCPTDSGRLPGPTATSFGAARPIADAGLASAQARFVGFGAADIARGRTRTGSAGGHAGVGAGGVLAAVPVPQRHRRRSQVPARPGMGERREVVGPDRVLARGRGFDAERTVGTGRSTSPTG